MLYKKNYIVNKYHNNDYCFVRTNFLVLVVIIKILKQVVKVLKYSNKQIDEYASPCAINRTIGTNQFLMADGDLSALVSSSIAVSTAS